MGFWTPPDTRNYKIPKGILSIAPITSGTIGAYVDIGNCPAFDFQPVHDVVEHKSSRGPTRKTDQLTTVEVGTNVWFSLDEHSIGNMKMFLHAELINTYELRAHQELDKEYALRFIETQNMGPKFKHFFWKVRLTPAGRLSLISDNYTTLDFEGRCLADETNHSESPFHSQWYITTTTSSSTTSSTSSTSSSTTTD